MNGETNGAGTGDSPRPDKNKTEYDALASQVGTLWVAHHQRIGASRIVIFLVSLIGLSGLGSAVWSATRIAGFDDKRAAAIAEIEALNQSGGAPIGTITAYGGAVTAEERKALLRRGWLLCDGAEVSRAEYQELFRVLDTGHGKGDGSTTFQIPDLRGRFVRGVDSGRGMDPDAKVREAAGPGGHTGDMVGTVQNDATALPRTPFTTAPTSVTAKVQGSKEAGGGEYFTTSRNSHDHYPKVDSGGHTHLIGRPDAVQGVNCGGDTETRPQNIAVHWLIRAK